MAKANENASKSIHQAKEDEIATEAGVLLKLQTLQPASEESVLPPTSQLSSSILKPREDK